MMKPFFVPGAYHVCRFCRTPIKKLKDGKLVPLANFAQMMIPYAEGGFFNINGCLDCLKSRTFEEMSCACEEDPAHKLHGAGRKLCKKQKSKLLDLEAIQKDKL